MKNYAEFKIIRPLYGYSKKISSSTLKVGDRFIYPQHKYLMFKTNISSGSKFLCCDDEGRAEWLEGEEKVIRINGVAGALRSYSFKFKEEYLRHHKRT